MIKTGKALLMMAAGYYFLVRPFACKIEVMTSAQTIAAVVGVMVLLSIVIPFVIVKD